MTSKLMLLAELVVPSFLIARNLFKKKKNELAAKFSKDKADKAVTDAINISKSKRNNDKHYHSNSYYHHRHGHHNEFGNDEENISNRKNEDISLDKKLETKKPKKKLYSDILMIKWQYMWVSLVIGLIIVIALILNRSYN